jgi:hypothetical protein
MNVNAALVFEFSFEAGWMLVIQEHMHRYALVEATETPHASEKLPVILSHLGRTTGGEGVGYDLHEETFKTEPRVSRSTLHNSGHRRAIRLPRKLSTKVF